MTKRLYLIIGDPIGQARSPDVFNARFARGGLDAEMLLLEVAPAGFADVMAGLSRIGNCGGVVVTIPHKPAAAGLASIRSKRVEIAGAANVMRWTGQAWESDLFDGEGFLGGLERRGWPTAGRRAAIVGAGGAGLAIGAALLERAPRKSRSTISIGVKRIEPWRALPLTMASVSRAAVRALATISSSTPRRWAWRRTIRRRSISTPSAQVSSSRM